MDRDLEDGAALLHYARQHGVARSCRTSDTDIRSHVSSSLDVNEALSDPKGARTIDLTPDVSVDSEKISLDADGRFFLASIIKSAAVESATYGEIARYGIHPSKRLKLELPLLRTDNELDLRRCYRNRAFSPSFGSVKLEIVPVNDREDEGVSWSPKSLDHNDRLVAEKLEVDKASLLWLQSALKNESDQAEELVRSSYGLEHIRKRFLEPLTPPLSPVEEDKSVPESSSPLHAFDLLPDHTSPTVHISKALDDSLSRQDGLWLHNDTSGFGEFNSDDLAEIYTPFQSDSLQKETTSPQWSRAGDLKIDEMLTPPPTTQVSRSIAYSDGLEKLAAKMPMTERDQVSNSQDDFDAFFNEVIEVGACEANKELENEQLQEADSTKRVPVPVLDFSIPTPPWKASQTAEKRNGKVQELLLPITKMKLHHLPVPRNERKLRWTPFPTNSSSEIDEENVADDDLVLQIVDTISLGPEIDPKTLTWKPDGLRVLKDKDEDTEIDNGSLNMVMDLEGLLTKRKEEMERQFCDTGTLGCSFRNANLKVQQPSEANVSADNKFRDYPRDHSITKGLVVDEPNLPFGDMFCASDELTRFLELQTGQISKKPKTTDKSFGTPKPATDVTLGIARKPNKVAASIVKDSATKDTSQTLLGEVGPSLLPCEDMPVPGESAPISHETRPIVVSSTLISQQRPLLKLLTALQSSIQLISRDFSASSPGLASEPTLSKVQSPTETDQEADIIVSPSTGIILTTLQKIKQKTLPGQGDMSALRKRILRVCPRYENLFVIVCHSAISTQKPTSLPVTALSSLQDQKTALEQTFEAGPKFQSSDIEALASLTSFAASLSSLTDVTINFLPPTTADTQAAARWILGFIRANPLPDIVSSVRPMAKSFSRQDGEGVAQELRALQSEWSLLQEETTWELLLRRAGMNAFASQGILLALKALVDASSDDLEDEFGGGAVDSALVRDSNGAGGVYGLPAFVLMSPQERRAQFAEMMGGVRVLDRVGSVFDRGWGKIA